MSTDKPEIRKKDKATTIDVVVNLPHGVVMRTSTAIAAETQKFLESAKLDDGTARNAYLLDPKQGDFAFDCTSCLNLMTLAIENGRRMQIKVDGEDNAAEQIALRIYSALTSGDSYKLDFYKYG